MIITALAEKESQGIDYYLALSQTTNSRDAVEKIAKKQGYLEIKSCSYLNNNTLIITWAKGHLVRLKEPEEYDEKWKDWSLENLPIIPDNFEYVVDEKRKKQFEIVKKKLKAAQQIIWAGDIDREGSYISYIICKVAGVWGDSRKTFKSLWIDDLTPKPVRKGFQNLQDIEYRYLQAQEAQARAIADWLLGMNSSRYLSKSLEEKLGLRVPEKEGRIASGRIISPTTYFIYKRELEIENFVERTYYELEGIFTHPNGIYTGKYIPIELAYTKGERKGQKWKGDCDTKEQWEKLILHPSFIGQYDKGEIVELEKELKETRSPRLYSLSDMQKEMNTKLGISPAETLAILQELYDDDKYVTYPRTSSNHISQERFDYLHESLYTMTKLADIPLSECKPAGKVDGFFVNNKKAAVHAGLTPTTEFPSLEEMESWSNNKRVIYMEVLKRSLAMFLFKYKYEQTTIITQVGNGKFQTIGRVTARKGWKILWEDTEALFDVDDVDEKSLINVSLNDHVVPQLTPVEKHTSKPKLYTEGKLIEAMETAGRDFDDEELKAIMKETQGLGTEATRAPALEKIKNYHWYVIKKGRIHLTELGRLLCQSYSKVKILSDAQTTALWEQSLRKITSGENTKDKFISNIIRYLDRTSEKNLFTDLEHSMEQVDFEPYKDFMMKLSKSATGEVGTCPKCGAPVRYITSKNKKVFLRCLNGILSQQQLDDGEVATCDFFLSMEIAGKKLTQKMASDLLEKKKTSVVKGFKKSKVQGTFDARVVLKDDGKLGFEGP